MFPFTDPVHVFAVFALVVLIAPLVTGLVRFPGASIVGLILAGVIIGPGVLGVIESKHELVRLLSAVGLLFIMFTAGLDVDPEQFARYRRHSTVFGLLTFIIPQVLGTVAALMLLGMNWPAAILLASMFASHTLVSYPIATRLGIARSPSVATGVGGTIITDTLALLVLAVIAAVQDGEATPAFWATLMVSIVAYGFVMLRFLPRLNRWYFRNFGDGGVRDFAYVLCMLFVAAALAKVAGLEPIIGAFLAGLAFARMIPLHSTLMSRLKFVGSALFIPFFLISIGMLVDLRLLIGEASSRAWLIIGVMSGTVIVTKYIAAKLAQRSLNFTTAEGNILFGLSVPQAAATLAAVFIGMRIGLFDSAVLNGAVVMILATCLIGPWFVERFGRDVALAEEMKPYEPGTAPLRILIPMANPASATPLMDLAFMVRRPDSPEPVYPLIVASEAGDVRAQVALGEQMLGHAVIHASSAGVPVVPVTYIDLNVAIGITRAIKEHRISTVVIGWSGSAPKGPPRATRLPGSSVILGTVLDRILADTPQTVLVCRTAAPIHTHDEARLVLVVPKLLEREPGFAEAMRTIKQLASRLDSSLVIFGESHELPHLKEGLNRIKPQVEMEFRAIEEWSDFDKQAAEVVEERDLLVLMSTREGRLPWSPDLNRMPRAMADRFPQHNLVVFYPSELTAETAWFAAPVPSPGAAAAVRLPKTSDT